MFFGENLVLYINLKLAGNKLIIYIKLTVANCTEKDVFYCKYGGFEEYFIIIAIYN